MTSLQFFLVSKCPPSFFLADGLSDFLFSCSEFFGSSFNCFQNSSGCVFGSNSSFLLFFSLVLISCGFLLSCLYFSIWYLYWHPLSQQFSLSLAFLLPAESLVALNKNVFYQNFLNLAAKFFNVRVYILFNLPGQAQKGTRQCEYVLFVCFCT